MTKAKVVESIAPFELDILEGPVVQLQRRLQDWIEQYGESAEIQIEHDEGRASINVKYTHAEPVRRKPV